MTIADKIIQFNHNLKIANKLPSDITVLNPFHNANTIEATTSFYNKYYSDNNKRFLILGINPGRFGAGITGIPFTDPLRLVNECGIENEFNKKPELSSDFIYRMIRKYGSVSEFYSKFIISSLCPLGFTRDGKNLNYYDDKELQKKTEPFIIETLKKQIDFGVDTNICYCLGEGKNYKYFNNLNSKYNFFNKIIPLAHPRYIMQYKRKMLQNYISDFVNLLSI